MIIQLKDTLKKSQFKDALIELNTENNELINNIIDTLDWSIKYYIDHDYNLNIDNYNIKELIIIRDALKKVKARKFVKQIDLIISILNNTSDTVIEDLEIFQSILIKVVQETKHKWLFIDEDICGRQFFIPYFLYNVCYEPAYKDKDGYYYEAKVVIELHSNLYNGFKKKLKTFYINNINGRNIYKILKDVNMYIENDELYDDYNKTNVIYENRLLEQGKQYKCTQYLNANSYYTSAFRSINANDTVKKYYRVVNDTKLNDSYYNKKESSHLYIEDKQEYDIPMLPFIRVYNLDTYDNCYCHVDDIEDYEYDLTLKDKLVLPESHKNLLDILVNHSSILKGDIIDNKGNGTVVILEGPPGCGKTLTTEVYSELIQKPLYRVSTGQLGINPNDIEKNLSVVLNRANRLGCILLLDECEIFVRKRNEDITQNAIVASFLRQIEYFDGILFLTSNRIKDVDEAILSRCIAAIKYEPPTVENAKKIWKIIAKQFNLENEVNDTMINTLIKIFPNAVGRDIKELLKLTARYCLGLNKSLSIKAFLTCAQFRYIDVDENFVESIKLDL